MGRIRTACSQAALAFLSAGLTCAAFPNWNLWPLAWIALVPVFAACRGAGALRAGAIGLFYAALTLLGVCHWIFQVPGFRWDHALALLPVLALPTACWFCFLTFLRRPVLRVVAGATAWSALDLLRTHLGFLSLTWCSLGQSQHANLPLLQHAAWLGEIGITFFVVLANLALHEWRTLRLLAMTAGLLGVVHLTGSLRLATAPEERGTFRVGLVQPALLPHDTERTERLLRLSQSLLATRPGLLVWPETAIRDLRHDATTRTRISEFSASAGVPLLVGVSEFEKFSRIAGGDRVFERRGRNTAQVIDNGRLVFSYEKNILVPFGEYLPIASLVPWERWLGGAPVPTLAGVGSAFFRLPNGMAVVPIICWENTFGEFVRHALRQRPDLMVQLTNDAWFGPTAAAVQHNLASIFRAVENGIPVVVASNTGPSLVVDAFGRVRAETQLPFVAETLSAAVPPALPATPFARFGTALAVLCGLGLCAIALTCSSWRKVQRNQCPDK